MEFIIASITTIPSRIKSIKTTIQSLLNQSTPVEFIILNVPEFSIRENTTYEIPNELYKIDKLIINRCQDYGPCTKIVPTLEWLQKHHQGKNVGILITDDDMIYHPNTLEDLLYYHKKFKNDAIGFNGQIVVNRPFVTRMKLFRNRRIWLGKTHLVDFLCGWEGILHQTNFFNLKELKTFINKAGNGKFTDDELFSGYLAKKNIKKRVCKHRKSKPPKSKQLDNGLNSTLKITPNNYYQDQIINRFVDQGIVKPFQYWSLMDQMFSLILPSACISVIFLTGYLFGKRKK